MLFKLLGNGFEHVGIETGAHFSCVAQGAMLIVYADQQGAETCAADRWIGVAANHELQALEAFNLEPAATANRFVTGVGAFADQTFEAMQTGIGEDKRSIAGEMFTV